MAWVKQKRNKIKKTNKRNPASIKFVFRSCNKDLGALLKDKRGRLEEEERGRGRLHVVSLLQQQQNILL